MSIYDYINYNTLIVLLGASLLGACAGLVGSFAVLRRRSLTGDALAHAALPGICLGFLIVEERILPLMLLGALVTGVVGTQVISSLRRYTRIKEDAAIGIVLSVFFGIGIVLKSYITRSSTRGSKAGLDSYIMGKTAGMIAQDVYLIAGVSLFCLLMVLLLYKEFKVIAFDSGFAQAQGWPVLRLDLLLMGLIAVTVVIGLPTVGAVMIAALLIIPSAAARFWADRLGTMLLLSVIFGFLMGVSGTILSATYSDIPTGPVIVLVGTAIFVLSSLFSPRRGVIARILARWQFRRDLQQRALLYALYEINEPYLPERKVFTRADLEKERGWSNGYLEHLIQSAIEQSHLQQEGERFRLTREGLKRSAEVARAQRLWELFMTEHAELAGSAVNLASDVPEEVLPEDLIQELSVKLEAQGRLPYRSRREVSHGTG